MSFLNGILATLLWFFLLATLGQAMLWAYFWIAETFLGAH